MRRFARGAAASGAVTMLGVALQSAAPMVTASCDGHECDPHWADYGCTNPDVDPSDPCCEQGTMVDQDTWATTLPNADWLPFLSYEQLRLHIGAWTRNRTPDPSGVLISIAPGPGEGNPDAPLPDADPSDAPVDIVTPATGNLGEILEVGPRVVVVENATCSPQLVRVVIRFPVVEGGPTEAMKGPCQRHKSHP